MKLVMADDLYPYLPQIADLIREHIHLEDVERHQAIAVVDDLEVVQAVTLYGNQTATDLQMHIASNDPAWCKRGIIRALFHYPFEQLKVQRVTSLISKRNKHARKFIERIGFKHEGTHPLGYPDGTTACSYGLLRSDCKWL